jgi:pimeloyl-ACP methyl ester carboxylesterase
LAQTFVCSEALILAHISESLIGQNARPGAHLDVRSLDPIHSRVAWPGPTDGGRMSSEAPDTIVLIHGLWMSPLGWEHWAARFERRGFRVLTPAWPGMDRPVEELRADTSAIDELGIPEILDGYEALIGDLAAPPIIMGHSFGGAFTEVLLDRGLGAAGVAIDAAGVRGIAKLALSTPRSGFPAPERPPARHGAVSLTFEEFHRSFTNTMDEQHARSAYERYAVPGPARVLWEGAFANFKGRTPLQLDFTNPDRAPLLIVAGGSDHVVPAVIDRVAARRCERSDAVTEFKEFPGSSPYTVGQDGWEEIADYALDWALENAAGPALAPAASAA